MKKRIFKFLFLLLFGVTFAIQAQQKEVKGTVSDSDGVPLPGATILIKGVSKGVSTDFNGNFSINASSGDVLLISFLGYKSREITLTTQTTLNVVLTSDISQLDEIVIGYGSVKKKDLTGSVSVLSTKDFNTGPMTGVENLIQGRAPGVQISTVSSEPGGEMLIRIRGNNSVNSNNSPLYVVDGFPMESLDNSLNPSDIESINILKDASATAIYGTRGANGVVVVTTKRGKEGKSIISYSGSYSTHEVDVNAYDFLNGADYANIKNETDVLSGFQPTYSQEAIARIDALGLQTNWMDEAFRTGTTSDHQLSIKGGSKDTKFFFSAGAYSWDGVVKNTSFDRYNVRLNADQNLLDGKLKFGINTSLSTTETNFLGFSGNSLQDNILRGIFRANPIVPTSEAWSTLSDLDKILIFGGDSKPGNPLQSIDIADNKSSNYFVLANAFLDFSISKDFKFKTQGGVRVTNSKVRRFLPSYSNLVASSLEPGAATLDSGLYKYYTFENVLSFDKVIDKHTINAILGATHEWSDNEYFSAGAKDFTTDALGYYSLQSGATPLTPVSYVSSTELISYLSRINYSYDDKYLFTFTFRRDGSSKFGAGNKWGNFPAAAVAWKVNNEDFFKSDAISTLKLRASYGITGSDRFRVGLGQSTFSASAPVTTDGANLDMGTISSRVGNSDLQWEETQKIDLGLEMGFFNDELTMEIAAYKNNTSKLLLQKSLPPSNGISSILTNSGEVQNSGIELNLNFNHNFKSGLNWNSNFSIAYNENEVKELILPAGIDFLQGPQARIDGSVFGSYTILKEGLPINSIYGYRFLGILQPGDVYEPQPNAQPGDPLFKDLNGDGVISADDKEVLGNGYPKYTFGFNNSVSYKNFTLSAFFAGVVGVDKINGNNIIGYQYNTLEIAKERWTPNNLEGTLPQKLWSGDRWVNDRFIEDASYVRMKNISLAYNFNSKTLEKIGLTSLQINVTGLNLLTWDSYSGFDPEVNSKGNGGTNLNVASGLDAYSYPYQRSFSLGLKIGI
ncbi:SusC/RagA family TonB-linked outer membrane protein [Lutibacter flavus]|uniref:TonB-linked outer membrane protein, SusC/RagA family n=1 Tax=Lutibacter flavus TaxID=691689 RepID=A0A238YUG3_9FLAO|nr:TonB-dependent receptor [Lutibacter flavus]SNR74785.1 TonB-linked outer membrane protein, SusC/RagA family [Lutibacter flavus]